MKNILRIILLFLAGVSALSAKDKPEYRVSLIPSEMFGAHVVVRSDIRSLKVRSESKATYRKCIVATIFSPEERDWGVFAQEYDQFDHIEEFEGAVYDQEGSLVKELEKEDIVDRTAVDGFSVYSDARMRIGSLYYDHYPYTVEFIIEIEYKGYMTWPTWIAQNSTYPVVLSHFEVEMPKGMALRFWSNADSLQPVITDGYRHYVWELHDLPWRPVEEYNQKTSDYSPVVKIAPMRFELDGRRGDLGTWQNFGKWIGELYRDKDQLPASIADEVRAIAQTQNSEREKIGALYRYMQSKTRYVSVQLGIGGWQPFEAAYVAKNGYGDCKALTNYMKAILKEAKITAYPVIIHGGESEIPLTPSFPANEFNHVILCVPSQADSVWLECTNQNNPAGHLGSFTEDRYALLISENGGNLVRTPASRSRENFQLHAVAAAISLDGSLNVTVHGMSTGNQADDLRSRFIESTPEARNRWLQGLVPAPSSKIEGSSISGMERGESVVRYLAEITASKVTAANGGRIFLTPNIMNKWTRIPKDIKKRISPIRFDYPYVDVDSVTFTLPAGFRVEAVPNPVLAETSFGVYSASCEVKGDGSIAYVRRMEIKQKEIPAVQYPEFREFFTKIVKSDKAQFVLVRK